MRNRSRRVIPALLLAIVAGLASLTGVTPVAGAAAPAAAAGALRADQGIRAEQKPRIEQDIRSRVAAIPGMTVTSDQAVNGGYRLLMLRYTQPVDHRHPEGGTFQQRINLLHKATDRPMILHTTGYGVPTTAFRSEPARLVDGNQVSVEHRFFPPSRPEPADWDDLTIWQMATDEHRIVEALSPIYPRPWISTGVSKGGMTAVYHRRFYPSDVDATVAYVAPNDVVNTDDSSYDRFFAQVGTDPACRAALKAVQRAALERRGELVARYQAYARTNRLSFDRVLGSADRAFEMLVLDLVWAFWQYNGQAQCPTVPRATASTDDLWAFLDRIATFRLYTDQGLTPYAPYYYQAAAQLGWPSPDFGHLRDLLHYPGLYQARSNIPMGIPVPRFQPTAMRAIDAWVRHRGTRLMFVYGQNDPWSAKPFRLGSGTRDAFVYVAPGSNHSASIARLATADATAATATLLRWAASGDGEAATVTGTPSPFVPGLDDRDPRYERRPL